MLTTLQMGALIAGRYELFNELGRGGYGRVWHAYDVLAKRPVALKLLRAEVSRDLWARRRLRREARAVARLEHPNIVKLFDLGEKDDGSPYLVLELVEGRSLSELAAEKLTLTRILQYIDQILQALAYAHARGVVHRDLKPENVIITVQADGGERVKLLDFGFARVEDDPDSELSIDRDLLGTPVYMAPEQATGNSRIGPATDLYALAVVLWELLCGRPPFVGNTQAATVLKHVTAPLPRFEPLPHLVVPDGLYELLARCLRKDPGKRPDSAASFRRAIRAVMGGADEDEAPLEDQSWTGHGTTLVEWEDEEEPERRPVPLLTDDVRLVGREGAQSWLWSRVEAVCEGHGPSCTLLVGPEGVGKTRLADWLARTVAEAGRMTTLKVTLRHDGGEAWSSRLLVSALGLPPERPANPEEALKGLELAGIDKELLRALLWARPARRFRAQAVGVVATVLRRLAAQRPLLLIFDDVDRQEPLAPVLALVTNLLASASPILVVATALRVEALKGPCARVPTRVAVLAIPPLEPEATKRLATQLLPASPELVETLALASGGLPLHLVQGASAPEALGPGGLSTLLAYQLSAWAESMPTLAMVARGLAVLGDAFEYAEAERVAEALGVEPESFEITVETLLRLGVLDELEGDVLTFAYESVRRAWALQLCTHSHHCWVHDRVADAMTASKTAFPPARIAVHRWRAGNTAVAVGLALVGAREALRGGDAEAALKSLGQGASWLISGGDTERQSSSWAELQILRAEAHLALERGEAAIECLALATRSLKLPGQRGELKLAGGIARAEALLVVGRMDEAEVEASAALAMDEAGRDGRAQGRLRRVLGLSCAVRGDLKLARSHLIAAHSALTAAHDGRRALETRLELANLALLAGDLVAGRRMLTEATQLARQRGEDELAVVALARIAGLEMGVAELPELRGLLEALLELAEPLGLGALCQQTRQRLGKVLVRLREDDAALAIFQVSLTELTGTGQSAALAETRFWLGWLYERRGDLPRAELHLSQSLLALGQGDELFPLVLGSLAWLAHRRGDLSTRQRRLGTALVADATRPVLRPEWPELLSHLADALLGEGQVVVAGPLLDRVSRAYALLGQPEQAEAVRQRRRALSG